MQIEVSSKAQLTGYFQKIGTHVTQNNLYATKYIDLGVKVKTIELINLKKGK